MLSKIIGVIGANFGDEGKGLMTDYFVTKFKEAGESCIVIKHNGGSQAGHTVVTPEGKRHVFGHFGSGTFQGVPTYFDKDFIVNPMTFAKEYKQLQELGATPQCYIHPDCRIQLPTDVIINQAIENCRGEDRHGSCGMGIWETVVRSQCPHLNLTPRQFLNMEFQGIPEEFRKWMHYVFNAEQYLIDRMMELDVPLSVLMEAKDLNNNINIWNNYIEDLSFMLWKCFPKTPEEIVGKFDSAVFETGQGLLLDEDNEPYAPHLTPSKTGACNIMTFLRDYIVGIVKICDVELCYVTRSYLTRHGAGKFPTECPKSEIFEKDTLDKTNFENEWQGALRYGSIYGPALFQGISRDLDTYCYRVPKWNMGWSVAVTHLDETEGKIVGYWTSEMQDYLEKNCKNLYRSYGESRNFVEHMNVAQDF